MAGKGALAQGSSVLLCSLNKCAVEEASRTYTGVYVLLRGGGNIVSARSQHSHPYNQQNQTLG